MKRLTATALGVMVLTGCGSTGHTNTTASKCSQLRARAHSAAVAQEASFQGTSVYASGVKQLTAAFLAFYADQAHLKCR